MSYSNGIITAPIAASDPYNVMWVNKASNGYDVGYICSNKHGKINKWAKYKPIDYPSVTALSEEQLKNGDYGMKLITAKSTVYDAINSNNYTYIPPKGGADSPYRLSDFNKYNHYADAPILFSTAETFFTWDTSVQEAYTFQIMCFKNDTDSLNIIQANSLLEDMYLCVAILATSNKYYIKTSDKTLKEFIDTTEDAYVILNRDDKAFINFNSGSEVEYYFLATNYKATDSFVLETEIQTPNFFPLPFADSSLQKGSFTIKKYDNIPIFTLKEMAFGNQIFGNANIIDIDKNGSKSPFRLKFEINNKTNSAYSMTSNEYQVNITGSKGTFYFQSYELVAINVPANGIDEFEIQTDRDVYNAIYTADNLNEFTNIEITFNYNNKLFEKYIVTHIN